MINKNKVPDGNIWVDSSVLKIVPCQALNFYINHNKFVSTSLLLIEEGCLLRFKKSPDICLFLWKARDWMINVLTLTV